MTIDRRTALAAVAAAIGAGGAALAAPRAATAKELDLAKPEGRLGVFI